MSPTPNLRGQRYLRADERPRIRVSIGGTELGDFVRDARIRSAVNDIPNASFTLDAGAYRHLGWDWQGEVVIGVAEPGAKTLFTGVVVRAEPLAGEETRIERVRVTCRGSGVVLEEVTVGKTVVALPPSDALHWLMRSSDWPEDRLDLQGEDALPTEVFEVSAPVENLSVQAAFRMGDVTLLPYGRIHVPDLEGVEAKELGAALRSARTVALVYVDAARTHDAETQGLARIDLALGWLASRAHDGAVTRSGAIWPFDRHVSLARPRRAEPTLVRGLQTDRFVLHRSSDPPSTTADLTFGVPWAMPPLHPGIPQTDQLAILAWNRAADSTLMVEQRVQALWDAMEFYAGSANVPHLFDKPTLDSLRSLLNGANLNADQQSRVSQMVGGLNAPPLLTRLRHASTLDGVQLNDHEMKLLRRLRTARNHTSHGRLSHPVRSEDLRLGLSIVARLLGARSIHHLRRSR